ncbi:MAG: amidase [Rhodospirillales bacterium]|nr:amidase [Rhodospirillales bacterium]
MEKPASRREDGSQAIWQRGILGLGRAYADKETTPVAALDAFLARLEAVNLRLNAVIATDLDGARSAAKASAERWARGEARGALDGIPLLIKDSIAVRGMPATWGSQLFKDFLPEQDELPVARLREAGAVILGKTNVPEFTITGHTSNTLFGTTGNPWNPALTPGGSSGGSVAAVAAGMAAAALGTDGGGSVRRPAALTGLVGLKPSTGRVARCHGLPVVLADLEVIGPIARTVADIAALYRVIAWPDPRDRASLAFSSTPPTPDVSRDPPVLRILYVPQFGSSPVDSTIAANVRHASENLAALGHRVEEGPPPFDPDDFNASWPVISRAGVAWAVRDRHWRDHVDAGSAGAIEAGLAYSATDYVEAMDRVRRLRGAVGEAFTRWDVILTPSSAALPWPAERVFPEFIDDHPAQPRDHAIFTGFVNATGYPAISVPCDPSPKGLPVGFQMVGRFGAEDLLLALAGQYERAHPWSGRWPGPF